jgi:hypothetical protein
MLEWNGQSNVGSRNLEKTASGRPVPHDRARRSPRAPPQAKGIKRPFWDIAPALIECPFIGQKLPLLDPLQRTTLQMKGMDECDCPRTS